MSLVTIYLYALTSHKGEGLCPLVRLCPLIIIIIIIIILYLYILYSLHCLSLQDALSSKHFMEKATSSFWLAMPSHDSSFLKL
jgi:hypothetical protein